MKIKRIWLSEDDVKKMEIGLSVSCCLKECKFKIVDRCRGCKEYKLVEVKK